ncbi:ATP-binding protein [Streptomyces sparsogenes DSM 40356]|uniref:ATP-binding protein n=2 Tax=Streptomyces sparsogenes TaxID=67365 RepID=A0A1R1SRD0_9ACTN|nr:ATP-binding protein [Streptomyces sparsogenes]OMI40871.1 ATP-binding protein [Streptomyces sparsogenes DSM 40356]
MNQPAPQVTTTPLTFTQLISSTRRGARLARLLSVDQLRSWGAPQDLTERAEIVVAELAANAALHGSLPGRSFRLTLVFDAPPGRLRVDVTDGRGDRWPLVRPASAVSDESLATTGRGLSLVAAIADRWDTLPYPPSGKTVRALLTSPPPAPRPNGSVTLR